MRRCLAVLRVTRPRVCGCVRRRCRIGDIGPRALGPDSRRRCGGDGRRRRRGDGRRRRVGARGRGRRARRLRSRAGVRRCRPARGRDEHEREELQDEVAERDEPAHVVAVGGRRRERLVPVRPRVRWRRGRHSTRCPSRPSRASSTPFLSRQDGRRRRTRGARARYASDTRADGAAACLRSPSA